MKHIVCKFKSRIVELWMFEGRRVIQNPDVQAGGRLILSWMSEDGEKVYFQFTL